MERFEENALAALLLLNQNVHKGELKDKQELDIMFLLKIGFGATTSCSNCTPAFGSSRL